MIIVILMLFILSSFGVCYMFGLKKTLQWIILLFGVWFIAMNTGFFINTKRFYIIIVFILPFLLLIFYSIYVLLIKKSVTISSKNNKNLFYIALFSVAFISLFALRIWINKFNADAMFYTNISNHIKIEQEFVAVNRYRNISFYYIASLANNPIDMYTIAGDLMQQFIIPIAIVAIVEKQVKKRSEIAIFTILFTIIFGLTLTFATSSLNWTIVPIVFLVMCAFGIEELKWTIFTPIAFSIFSMSATLLFPCAILLIIFKKKIDLKNLFMLAAIVLLGGFILISGSFTIPLWTNIAIPLLVIVLLLSRKFIKTNIVINNFLFFENDIFTKKRKNIFLAITSSIAMLILTTLFVIYGLSKDGGVYFWVDIFSLVAYLSIFTVFIYQLFTEEKVSDILKVVATFFIVQTLYFIAIKISAKVPWYIHTRISSPIAAILLGVLFLSVIDYYNKDKVKIIIFAVLASLTAFNCGVRVFSAAKRQGFIYRHNSSFEQRYRWITLKEKEIIEKETKNFKGEVYSDLPIFVLPSKINSTFNIWDRDMFFYGMSATMEKHSKEDIYAKNKSSQVDLKSQKTIEYAAHFNDWKTLDKVDKFLFRNKKYAKLVSDHYGIKMPERVKGLFILTK